MPKGKGFELQKDQQLLRRAAAIHAIHEHKRQAGEPTCDESIFFLFLKGMKSIHVNRLAAD